MVALCSEFILRGEIPKMLYALRPSCVWNIT